MRRYLFAMAAVCLGGLAGYHFSHLPPPDIPDNPLTRQLNRDGSLNLTTDEVRLIMLCSPSVLPFHKRECMDRPQWFIDAIKMGGLEKLRGLDHRPSNVPYLPYPP